MPSKLLGAEPCTPETARIVSLQGTVELRRADTQRWATASLDDPLCMGDMVRVGAFSRAGLAFANNSLLRLDQRTTLHLGTVEARERTLLGLLRGAVYFFSRQPRALEVDTPFVNAGAEGTEFSIRVTDDAALIIMYEGLVRATNPQGELLLAAGEASLVRAGEAPRPEIVARPRDAVAWALYYPPIFAALAGRGAVARPLPRALASAAERAAANDYAGALAALDEVPPAARDAESWVFRAGVLLNVGQVDGAEQAIQQALALQPDAGTALAQRAIIAITQNRGRQALPVARRALEAAPDAPSAYVALSYALQANFQLEAARDVLREAASRFPEDALIFARLAEIELSLGYLDEALEAAEQAAALEPGLARAQMVLGFAELASFEVEEAKAAFGRAIGLESANPLPRLGLGLAQIRESDLAEGRREIEIAAALDPNSSLIRSYLGKAYFEENRDRLASEQLQIAKQLDPNDPTPWFYDAIQKQLENRPVEALHDLQTSIELNDNRAVYRSRFLLDEDLATRSVSLARIYDDLGFEQAGLGEASKSLGLDPANWSAHRFLADIYATLPRYEIARASELLQAQLLQPININPVQPSAQFFDLNVVQGVGPADLGLNEFHPLFERNQTRLAATGFAGNNKTFGDELIASAILNELSLSAGQFYSETNGFRPNSDIQNDLYNLFAQYALTPASTVQFEYRRRDTDQGDITLNFDPDFFVPTLRNRLSQDLVRVGGHHQHVDAGHFVFSGIYTDFTENVDIPNITAFEDDQQGYQVEGQHIVSTNFVSATSGAGYYDLSEDLHAASIFGMFQGPPKIEHANGYSYWQLNMPASFDITLGLSFDEFERPPLERSQINPKLGVVWQTSAVRFRAALLRTLARARSLNQTIEPTTVAGFNQFFDDFPGTSAWQYSIGLDAEAVDGLLFGLHYTMRTLEGPVFLLGIPGNELIDVDQNEDIAHVYAYWAATERLALRTSVEYEHFEQEGGNMPPFSREVETWLVPVALNWFQPSGVFAELRSTFVQQDVTAQAASRFPTGDDAFVVVDGVIGFRFPKRRGLLSLEVANLFDTDFNFQDVNFRTNETVTARFIPDRTVLARLTLSF